jgi:hypothetical protein
MNKAITLTLPHELGRAEAKQRIDEGFASFARHMGVAASALSKSWSGDRLSFALQALGQGVSGTIDVEDAVVRLEVLLPGLLALMADRMRGRLQREGQLLLEKK